MAIESSDLSVRELNDVVSRLGGAEGVQKLLKGDLVVISRLPTSNHAWMRLTIGQYQTPEEYYNTVLDLIKTRTVRTWVSEFQHHPISKVLCAKTPTVLPLVKLTVAEMGFPRGIRYKYLCARAKEMGFALCPNEVGPALRLAYRHQNEDENIFIGMEPIVAPYDGKWIIFTLTAMIHKQNLSQHLHTASGRPEDFWKPDAQFVFVDTKA